jgi:flagellin-like hook-associated protein FlgL
MAGGTAAYDFSIDTAGADATAGVALTATWTQGVKSVAGNGFNLSDDIAGYSQAAASFGGGATYAFSIGTIGKDATADVNLTAAWSSATGGGFTLTDVVSGVSDAAASFGGGASYAFSIETTGLAATENVKIHFGTGNERAEDYYYVEKQDMTSSGLGIADMTIANQTSAQDTIAALNSAIASKDTSRAHFGAMMNRLANTVSNIQIQAENIQAAESQISDVDVALEMTRFVSNQIKAQAAVAMLAQANMLPQLALTLLGGGP